LPGVVEARDITSNGNCTSPLSYDRSGRPSGIGNVFLTEVAYKLSGLVQLPFEVNVSGFYNARQGYPYERFIQSALARQRRRDHLRAPRKRGREPVSRIIRISI